MSKNEKLKVLGKFPNKLYKAFEQKAHRDAFLNGLIRMGSIKSYKQTECKKRLDKTEGDGHYQYSDMVEKVHFTPGSSATFTTQEPGFMTSNTTLGNPIYILCTSTVNTCIDYLKSKFGEYNYCD